MRKRDREREGKESSACTDKLRSQFFNDKSTSI